MLSTDRRSGRRPRGTDQAFRDTMRKIGPPGASTPPQVSRAQVEDAARRIAALNYSDYSGRFLSPSVSLMITSGLWIERYAAVGFLVGLGLSSLTGQRTVPVILLIVLEIVLTPLLSHSPITHLINLQRALAGIARNHFEPGGLPSVFGGAHNGGSSVVGVTENTTVASRRRGRSVVRCHRPHRPRGRWMRTEPTR